MRIFNNMSQLTVEQYETALMAVACAGGYLWGYHQQRMNPLKHYAVCIAMPACVALGFEIVRQPWRASVLVAPVLFV